jgi:hypothetical protein
MPQRSTAVRQLKTPEVAAVIREMNGNLAAVARKFNVQRHRIYRFIEQHPSLKQVLADARESMLDNAESTLYKKALEGDTTALIFLLKTQGYKRGYTERQHHTIDMNIRQMAEQIAAEHDLDVEEVIAEAERIVNAR